MPLLGNLDKLRSNGNVIPPPLHVYAGVLGQAYPLPSPFPGPLLPGSARSEFNMATQQAQRLRGYGGRRTRFRDHDQPCLEARRDQQRHQRATDQA